MVLPVVVLFSDRLFNTIALDIITQRENDARQHRGMQELITIH